MTRNRERRAAFGVESDDGLSLTAGEAPDTPDENLDTGLVDKNGRAILRRSVRTPMGFRVR